MGGVGVMGGVGGVGGLGGMVGVLEVPGTSPGPSPLYIEPWDSEWNRSNITP